MQLIKTTTDDQKNEFSTKLYFRQDENELGKLKTITRPQYYSYYMQVIKLKVHNYCDH